MEMAFQRRKAEQPDVAGDGNQRPESDQTPDELVIDFVFFEDHATHLRFFFDRRQNDHNYGGHWVDVAATEALRGDVPANANT